MASIGIDLGTSNSCVATIDERGRPRIVVSQQGQRTLPSVVAFLPDGRVLTGDPARRQALTMPRETIYAAKRLMGRRYSDPAVQRLAGTLPYAVVASDHGDALVDVRGKRVSPQEIAAFILTAVREFAAAELGTLDEAIVTVPAHFDAVQRQATMDAAQIAGLSVRRLLSEPTAAALGFGFSHQLNARIAVCDLGGGTFDVSILHADGGVFEVIATHGDLLLGGDDVDRRMVERLGAEIRTTHGLDVFADPTLLARVRDEAVRGKHFLSEQNEARLAIPYLSMKGTQAIDWQRSLGRGELEGWVADIIARLDGPCHAALQQAGLTPRDIDQVLLVGGATRMPAVAARLEQLFDKKATRQANPDEAIAVGAAVQCAILDGLHTGVVLLDVTARAIGLHLGGGRYAQVVAKNATLPTRESRVVPTSVDGQRELSIEVFEGESADVRQNRPVGHFIVTGLPDAPAGEVLVLVDFTVDVNGILRVSARELGSGAPAEVRLRAASGLTRREVRKLTEIRRSLR